MNDVTINVFILQTTTVQFQVENIENGIMSYRIFNRLFMLKLYIVLYLLSICYCQLCEGTVKYQ